MKHRVRLFMKEIKFLKTLMNKSKFLITSIFMLALINFIPACSDSGDPISPGNGGGNTNQSPTLSAIGNQYVAVNNPLNVTISASDAESTPTFTILNKPTSAAFTDNLDGTATFSWTPSLSDAGIASVTFSASDDSSATVNEIVTIEIITQTYDNYLGALIQSTCGTSNCHGAPTFSSGFDARTYIGLLAGGSSGQGPGIVPGDTANSIVYQRLLGNGGASQMPLTGTKFTTFSGRMDSIATWILARAPEN